MTRIISIRPDGAALNIIISYLTGYVTIPIDRKTAANLAQAIKQHFDTTTDAETRRLRAILENVADFYGVTLTQLCSSDRHRSIAKARLIYFHVARQQTTASYSAIARIVNRHPTTAMHGDEQIDRRRQIDSGMEQEIVSLSRDYVSELIARRVSHKPIVNLDIL